MLDIKRIKENPEAVKAGLRAKEVDCDAIVDRILELDEQRRALIARNPLYGRIICRCESVTEGEIVDAIHSGELEKAEFITDEIFGLAVPTTCPNVPSEVLVPESSWADKAAYKETATNLAAAFHKNFAKFADQATPEVCAAGPKAGK